MVIITATGKARRALDNVDVSIVKQEPDAAKPLVFDSKYIVDEPAKSKEELKAIVEHEVAEARRDWRARLEQPLEGQTEEFKAVFREGIAYLVPDVDFRVEMALVRVLVDLDETCNKLE
ncbi:hypothetical protein CkaCkLH20_05244 [Colletotrichum karsti]|uniref:Uncharacterized protein n=1 Tax=Colletotrichum karsti TaxID=1095194 RepID=A0A9P6LIQ7_9PEZI|nr:uncharacterized protein CkaCkLH20_05244 [Colletotrichum karsti]KAF9877544.1 hypothetical protein CkaCkLH20_05244 [Colletotrichum karsti]